MKRFLCVILSILLMTSAFIITGQAAGNVAFSAEVVSDNNGNVHLVFSLNQGSGLGAFKLFVAYDPAMLEISEDSSEAFTNNLTGTEADNMLWAVNTSTYNQNISGSTATESKVIIGGAYNGTSGLTNGGKIFTLSFNVKAGAPDGDTVVNVTKGEMAYADGTRCEGIASVPDTITLTIEGGIVTESTSSQAASDVILPFDSTSNFSTAFATTSAIETNEKREGSGSMRMGFSAPTGQTSNVGGMLFYNFTSSQDFTKYNSFSMNIYTPLAMDGNSGRFEVNFITSSSGQDGYNFSSDISNLKTGWNTISFNKSAPTATVSGTSWSNINRIRLTWFNDSQISRSFFLLDNLVGYYNTGTTSSSTVTSSIPTVSSSPSSTTSIVSTPDATNYFDSWVESDWVNVTAHSHSFVENNYTNTSVNATIAQEFIPRKSYLSSAKVYLLLTTGTGYVRFSIRTDANDASTEVYGNNYSFYGDDTQKWCVANFSSDIYNNGSFDENNKPVKLTPGQKYYLVYYYVLCEDANAIGLQYLDNTGGEVSNSAYVKVHGNSSFTRNSQSIAPFQITYDTEVEHVANLINSIGTVTDGSKSIINEARNAYNNLNTTQKNALSYENTLLQNAENTYNALPKGFGDINGDGIVHATDALMALKTSVGSLSLTSDQQILANVDGSAGISATDAVLILRYSIGLISGFTAVTTTAPAAHTYGYNPEINSNYSVTATIGSTTNIKAGDTFTLPVTLSSHSNGYAYITVSIPNYDTTKLEFLGFQAGSGFSGAYVESTSSLYAVMPTITNSSQASANASGQVVNLSFRAKENINTSLTITSDVYAAVYTSGSGDNWVANSGASVMTYSGSVEPPAIPTFSITSTNDLADSQTVTLTITSSIDTAGYYFGTSSAYANNTLVETTSKTPTVSVDSSGTFYFTVIDSFGNTSETQSAVFYETILDANGADYDNTSVLTFKGNSFNFPVYAREGYGYNGWSTDPYAITGGVYQLTPNADSTYYALWQDATNPTVEYASTNDVASSQTLTFTLSDNDSIAGYYFGTNWDYGQNTYTISSDSSVEKTISESGTYYFTAKDSHGNCSETLSVTFYATTLNGNGGTVANGLSSIITLAGNSFDLPAAELSDSTFNGWNLDADASSGVFSLTPDGNNTYYAVWDDVTIPTAIVESTNNVASSQTLTFTFQDNGAIAGYYFGTSDVLDEEDFIATSEVTATQIVSDSGVYYLTVKDASGNLSETIAITFYKTTLNGNGGTVSPEYILTKAGQSFNFPNVTNQELSFMGWSLDAEASSGITALTPVEDSTYYAIWGDETKPTVSMECTNNIASSQTVTFTFQDNSSIKGYYFGTSANYAENDFVNYTETTLEMLISAPGTYYITVLDDSDNISATLSVIFYEIVLNANGGNTEVTNLIVKAGNSIVPVATREGYLFGGWSTNSDAVSGETTISSTANNTYYALWIDAIKPTGSMTATNNVASSQTVNITLSDNEGVAGYYFGTSADYSKNTLYATSESQAIQLVSQSGTYYLTVRDALGNISDTVSITFYKTILNANGGNVSLSEVLTEAGRSFDLPFATKYGYSFVGWSEDANATSGVNSLTPEGDGTYYAVWDEISAPVVSLENTNDIAGQQTVTITAQSAVGVAGYWWGTSPVFSENNFVETSDTTITKIVNSAGTYYFTLMDNIGTISSTLSVTFYEIVLNANGGILNTPIIIAEKDVAITLPSSTKTSCEFLGWSNDANALSGVVDITPVNNATYYAIWKVLSKPTLSLGVTNNLASTQDVTITMGSDVGIAGYYIGTSSDYSENTYVETTSTSAVETISEEGTYYITVKDVNGNLSNTLYVTFFETVLNANGGTVSLESVLTRAGNSFGLPTPQKDGYTFNGWSASSDATSGIYTITPSANTTYYAVWIGNISISATVGSFDEANYGTQIRIPVTIGEYLNSYASIVINGITYDSSVLEFVTFEIPDNDFINSLAGAPQFNNDLKTYYIINVPENAQNASNTSNGVIAYLVFNVIKDVDEESAVSVSFDTNQTMVYVNGQEDNWTDTCKVTTVEVTSGYVISSLDEIKPVGSIVSTSNVANSQVVTITLSDDRKVADYYFGTSSVYTENTRFAFVSETVTKDIVEAGTYYLTVVDEAGNLSDTVSITFNTILLYTNDGTSAIEYLIVPQGEEITLPIKTRADYTHIGWGLNEDSTEGVASITVTQDATYYAVWENDAEKAQVVIDMINNIGEVTLDSEEEIIAARDAFDALSDSQKLLVDNIDVLEDAEFTLNRLKNFILGDVDGDGEISVLDVLSVLQHTVKKVTLNEIEAAAANVDGRSGITVYDALLILQRAIGRIDKFPAES